MTYGASKALARRTPSDKALHDKAFKILVILMMVIKKDVLQRKGKVTLNQQSPAE